VKSEKKTGKSRKSRNRHNYTFLHFDVMLALFRASIFDSQKRLQAQRKRFEFPQKHRFIKKKRRIYAFECRQSADSSKIGIVMRDYGALRSAQHSENSKHVEQLKSRAPERERKWRREEKWHKGPKLVTLDSNHESQFLFFKTTSM